VKAAGKPVFNIDYAADEFNIEDAYLQNSRYGYIAEVSPDRALKVIPAKVNSQNIFDVDSLKDAKNFLPLLNPQEFATKEEYLAAIAATDYDLVIVDLFYGGAPLSAEDVDKLKRKKSGGRRLVFAYMSVGEANDFRYYWQKEWSEQPPAFLADKNEYWNSWHVYYWQDAWRNILYGSDDAYLDRIMAAGFDGAFLDTIDTWQFFSEKEKLTKDK